MPRKYKIQKDHRATLDDAKVSYRFFQRRGAGRNLVRCELIDVVASRKPTRPKVVGVGDGSELADAMDAAIRDWRAKSREGMTGAAESTVRAQELKIQALEDERDRLRAKAAQLEEELDARPSKGSGKAKPAPQVVEDDEDDDAPYEPVELDQDVINRHAAEVAAKSPAVEGDAVEAEPDKPRRGRPRKADSTS